jgi:hypothetical protein
LPAKAKAVKAVKGERVGKEVDGEKVGYAVAGAAVGANGNVSTSL